MNRITLFAEDVGHEQIITALIRRLASDQGVGIEVQPLSVRGGHGRVISELKDYLRDLRKRRIARVPDLLVVATDANCKGLTARRNEVSEACKDQPLTTICAVPDPHIERWLLLDSAAFKRVLGHGCSAPDQKCERDRYKQHLRNAVLAAKVTPLLGGIEYAEDIVRIEKSDASFGNFVSSLRAQLKQWADSERRHANP